MSHAVGDALAACADRLGDAATGVLARLAGPLGSAARDAYRELAVQTGATRTRRRADIAGTARVVLPAGLRAIDPSWIEAALAELPARARSAVAAPSADPIDVWLARWAMADMPPLSSAPYTHDLERLVARPRAALEAWLVEIGADQLVYALGSQLATTRPELAAARERIARPPRRGNLGPRRAAVLRCRGITLDEGRAGVPSAVLTIAMRALAPHLARDPLTRMQLVRRFPRALGVRLAAELDAHAAAPLADAPALAALVDG